MVEQDRETKGAVVLYVPCALLAASVRARMGVVSGEAVARTVPVNEPPLAIVRRAMGLLPTIPPFNGSVSIVIRPLTAEPIVRRLLAAIRMGPVKRPLPPAKVTELLVLFKSTEAAKNTNTDTHTKQAECFNKSKAQIDAALQRNITSQSVERTNVPAFVTDGELTVTENAPTMIEPK